MPTSDLLSSELQFTESINNYLVQIAKWGKFLAILGFIMVGLLAIMAFVIPQMVSTSAYAGMEGAYQAGYKVGMTVAYLVIALIMFFPCLYLLRFGNKMKEALQLNQQSSFEDSFGNLKSLFKFYGILTIIVLCFYALALILVIAGFAVSGM